MDTETKIELTYHQARILEILQIGHERAIRRVDLQKRLQMDERLMREIIESLRLEGYLIMINPKPPYGYFIAETQEEVEACKEYFRSRVRNEYQTFRSIKLAAKKKFSRQFGQIPMFGLTK